ncbi:TetR/AcrR family transcriptional regulator [Rhodococcus rhodnii]|nr:TetR/AcrR family transcriptional regulator [Rhodococcus rhodnii]
MSRSKAAARIRAAAVAEFAEHGYGGTTTRQIAARLDLSPAAMYPHYRSKEELLFAISYEGHRETQEVLAESDLPGEQPVVRLRSLIAAFTRWQAAHHALAKVVQYELGALTPEHYLTVVEVRRSITALFRSVVEKGITTGDFDSPDAEGVTLALMSLCVDVCRWFPAGAYTDPDAVATLYADLATRLVGAEPATLG